MSFLGWMTVRAHEARVRHLTYLFETRGDIISDRDATIGRLQRENARLLDQVTSPQEQKDEGATYVLKSLADALGVTDWSIQNGSEEWEGDVHATMHSILVDAGVVDEEDSAVATHAKIIGLERAVSSLRPDAQKWRDRKKADRECRAEKRAKVGEGVS